MDRCLARLMIVAWFVVTATPLFAENRPLKVFVLAGQSNMQGHAHVRTLEAMRLTPEGRAWADKLENSDGKVREYDDVVISYLSSDGIKQGVLSSGYGADESKFGPELAFGITVAEQLNEPVLLIKTAWGGKSLHTDFRPPSSEAYEFSDDQLEQMRKQSKDVEALKKEKIESSGVYYRSMIEHVKRVLADIENVHPAYDANVGYELAGFVWFQGWNDMVDSGTYPNRSEKGGYDQYSQLLEIMIKDLRKDLSAPKLPVVVGVLGVGGPVAKYSEAQRRYSKIHQGFRDAMAAPAKLPEFEGNVANVLTEDCWDLELSELRDREADLKQKVRELVSAGEVKKEDQAAKERQLLAEAFSERERTLLEKGASNLEFHYLGSAKIMTCIGNAFAEAMLGLLPQHQ